VRINPKREIENVNVNQSNLKQANFKFHFYDMMLSIMFIYGKENRKTYDFNKLARSTLFRQSDIICIINRLNQLDQHLSANLNEQQLNVLLNHRKALVLS
jgi:ribosomal protein S15P/S13E